MIMIYFVRQIVKWLWTRFSCKIKQMPEGIKTDANCRRPYRLGKRQESIDETRSKMVEAARELILSKQALAGFSIDAVAKQAGVARMTVYNQFGGRRGLLEALFDDIGRRGG